MGRILLCLFPEIICVREINLNNIHKISLMKSCGSINSSADVLQAIVMFSIVSLLLPFWQKKKKMSIFQLVLVVKNLSVNAGDIRDVGLSPQSGRSLGG